MTEFKPAEEILTQNAKPVTFGSCISFLYRNDRSSAERNFLAFPGLLRNKIVLHDFKNSEVPKLFDIDFSFSLFKILPFDESNFKYQALVRRDLVQQEDEFKNLGKIFLKISLSK